MTKVILGWLLGGLLGSLALLVAIVLWHAFLLPLSLDEYLFRHRLEEASAKGATEIRFTDVAPFDWDEVCFHPPYNGDWRYDKYERVYKAPQRGAQDGIETLLFIRHDGRPTYFVGTAGIRIIYERRRCWLRDEAIMTKDTNSHGLTYAMNDDIQ